MFENVTPVAITRWYVQWIPSACTREHSW